MDELRIKLAGRGGKLNFNGKHFEWQILKTRGNTQFRQLPFSQAKQEIFDGDKIGAEITLRHWRNGDRFQPIGLKSPVKLQDLFVNAKIPRAQRHELVVAESVSGEIFWVDGLRISENFKITPQTERKFIWRHQALVK